MGAELSTQFLECLPMVAADVIVGEAPSFMGPGRNTVLIFDWDDTLLCSTAVRTQRWTVQELERLEVAVESLLRTSMSLGETLIVTNGNATWVQESASRYLPGLLPLLAQLRVVSARALYEDRYPGNPFKWKFAAFEQLLLKERHFSADVGANLIAVGDQLPEIEAARRVGTKLGGPTLVKTVKFREQPSVADLLGQLAAMEQSLARLVQETTSHSYQSHALVRDLPALFAPFAGQPLGWKCVADHEELLKPGGFGAPKGFKDIVSLFTN